MNSDIIDGSNQISSDDRSRNSQSDDDELHSLDKNLFESFKQIFSKCENVPDDVQREIYDQFMTFHNLEVNKLIINQNETETEKLSQDIKALEVLIFDAEKKSNKELFETYSYYEKLKTTLDNKNSKFRNELTQILDEIIETNDEIDKVFNLNVDLKKKIDNYFQTLAYSTSEIEDIED